MHAPDVMVRRVDAETLSRYADIPISFEAESVFRVELIQSRLGGVRLTEERVPRYTKDYDAHAEDTPMRWPHRFDVSAWALLFAVEGDRLVSGATVAPGSAEIQLMRGRTDAVALWDLRIRPEYRRRGVGTRLFEEAVEWARERGFVRLMIETQNTNVPACRFYVSRGCELGEIDRNAYPSQLEAGQEVMLLWHMELR